MPLSIDNLAIELAGICQDIGIAQNDLVNFKRLVQSLGTRDAILPTTQQKGYAKIAQSYKASGYTRLFNKVQKNMLATNGALRAEVKEAVSEKEVVEEKVIFCQGFLLTLNTDVDLLKICNWVSAFLQNNISGKVVIRSAVPIVPDQIDFLIGHMGNCLVISRLLESLSYVTSVSIRQEPDVGSLKVTTELEDW